MRLLRRSSAQPVSPNSDDAQRALVEGVRDGRKLWFRFNLALEPLLAFIKQGYPLGFEVGLEEDADWAVFRRMPGRGRA